MADANVAPGAKTSEFKLAVVGNVVGLIMLAAGGGLAAIPDASRPSWVGMMLAVIGAAVKLLTSLGYMKTRKEIKIAALVAAGAAKAVADADQPSGAAPAGGSPASP